MNYIKKVLHQLKMDVLQNLRNRTFKANKNMTTQDNIKNKHNRGGELFEPKSRLTDLYLPGS